MGNGTRSVELQPSSAREMRIYSPVPLKPTVSWNIYKNGLLLTSFTETPHIINIPEGMQYARLIGASKSLIAMTDAMPASLAATLGFVNEDYALLALEEDVMDPTVQENYRTSGVPELFAEDIIADAADTASLPLADWESHNNISNDISASPVVMTNNLMTGIKISIARGVLQMLISEELLNREQDFEITLYDLQGKIIVSWVLTDFRGNGTVSWNFKEAGLENGLYLLRIKSGTTIQSKRVVLK